VSVTVSPSLAVVPARGGSKGLPGKNIRPLGGLPLLVHSLRCAGLASGLTRTIVSTDSDEIAAVARTHGGDVPFLRPAELARDDTPMMPVLAHALMEIERQEGRRYETVVLLDPTSPGRLPTDIDGALALLAADPAADGAVACSEPHFNPLWVGVFERDGYMRPAFDASEKYGRRQDVPRFLRINGGCYAWRSDFVRGAPVNWRTGKNRIWEIPEERAFSIDNQFEFDLLELLLQNGKLSFPWLDKK
jgi:CMP-N,N'-diacetyllegionaminic acid synthase